MKKCTTFKEYIKILRKYCMRRWRKHRYVFDVWLEYDITTEEQVREVFRHKKYCRGNLLLILGDFLKYKDRELYWECCGVLGVLRGVQLTNEDCYWMFEVRGRIRLESCVGGFGKPVED